MTTWGAADVEKRLNDGAWLKPGEAAVLFGKSRWTVINWLKNGAKVQGQRLYIGFRETPGGHRELDPADIRKVLDAYRTRQTTEPPSDS